MRRAWPAVALLAASALAASCGSEQRVDVDTDGGPRASSLSPRGDGARGKQLLGALECNRCHTTFAVEPAAPEKQCTGCHAEILRGMPSGTPTQIARWREEVAELGDVPSLEQIDARFRREWVASFLRAPHDLRPALVPTMPRLPLDEGQALDIATFLVPSDDDDPDALRGANAAHGEELVRAKECALCHHFEGAAAMGASPPTTVRLPPEARALRLAPNLRYTRDRFRAKGLVEWLLHPSFVKPATLMPDFGLTREEARDVAAYLVTTPLAPLEKRAVPVRLPVLVRQVTYDEVASRVFRKTCWHCHGEPDFERGDGGPGNSGGFGFKGKGIDLSSFPATFAGWVDENGERRSLFAPSADGTPYLVASLVARQHEEAGELPEVRGMPLGMPALTPAELQLVETWIAQGRRR